MRVAAQRLLGTVQHYEGEVKDHAKGKAVRFFPESDLRKIWFVQKKSEQVDGFVLNSVAVQDTEQA